MQKKQTRKRALNYADSKFRGKAEEALQRLTEEKRYQRLIESTNVIPWEADATTGIFTYVGPQAENLFGYPIKEWYGDTFWPDHIHPQDRKWAVDFCLDALKTKKEYEFEYRMLTKNGRSVWLRDIVSVMHREDGKKILTGFLLDITELKKMQESIQISEKRYRTMIEQSPLSTQILTPSGKTLMVNKAWEELWGAKLEHLKDYNMLKDKQLVTLGIMPYVKKGFKGEPTHIPAVKYEPNKTLPDSTKVLYRWVSAIIYPVKDEGLDVSGYDYLQFSHYPQPNDTSLTRFYADLPNIIETGRQVAERNGLQELVWGETGVMDEDSRENPAPFNWTTVRIDSDTKVDFYDQIFVRSKDGVDGYLIDYTGFFGIKGHPAEKVVLKWFNNL